LFGILAFSLGIVLVWGVFAPRSQWRALAAWSVSDPHVNEPGGAAYGWRRFMSALGALALGAIVVVSSTAGLLDVRRAMPEPGAIQTMWGSPEPDIVNRVVKPAAVAPAGLVEFPVIDYQEFGEEGLPDYLAALDYYQYLGQDAPLGYIGGIPDVGYSGVDRADLVVHIRGPILCIPRAAIVIETEETIQIAIYYGLPNDPAGAVVDHVVGCPEDATLTASLLIPIELRAPVGDRTVETLAGAQISRVVVPLTTSN
jgi:hypothetical protein